jgi:glycosyltransferase involved in cell wall biosynthesis
VQDRWSVAAVIPTYNRATLVRRAIDSVLAQRRPPDEVIVVDDGSTDDTVGALAGYGDAIRLVEKQNGGVSSARNLGVEESTSDFVAFLDSDDLWYDEHLLRMDRAIAATGGRAALYFSDLELSAPRREGTAWEWSRFSVDGDHELVDDARPWLFRDVQPMMIPASVFRRDAYLAAGGCDTALSCREDTHLFFKVGLAAPMCAVAGVAGLASGDSPTSLTITLSPAQEAYWRCTTFLYDDVMQIGAGSLTAEQRGILTSRIADAYFMLARNSAASSPGRALHHLGDAIRTDPWVLPRRVRRRLRRAAGRLG